MKKHAVFFILIMMIFLLSACGKTGKDSIAENDSLARILGTGAAGMGRGADDPGVADLPDVNHANMRSNGSEGVDYFKLMEGSDTVLDPGDYTVGMADNMCSVTVKDADGNATQTVTIKAQGDGGKSPIKSAANITVPEGGSAVCIGGTCIAQKKE